MKDVRHSISALFVLIVLVLASCIEGATVLAPWGETVTDLSPTDGTALVTVRPTLRWKAVDGAIKYYVQLALDDEDLESTPMTEVLEAAYSPSENLMDGVVYRWRVRAVNATNQLGPWSVVSSLSVGKNWLSKETALGVIRNTTDGSVKYQIEISDNREALDGFVQEEDSPIDKKTYYAIFKDADGEDAPWSAVYMLSVGWSEDISGLGITDDAVASLSLQIEYSQLGGVNYLGMLSASRAELESMASDRAILSNMPSGAIGTSFYWHVREVKEDELAGSWSKVNTLVLDDILEAVSGLSPANGSATTDTTPALSWSETSGAASYQIRMADSESGLENAVPVEEEGEIHHPTTAWDNSDVHYWQVRAKDANGQYGPWSAIHSLEVTWGAIDELSPAAGSSTTDTTPALSWNAVSGAAGYEVQIAGSEAGLASAQSVEVSAASYTPSTALTNNQTHYWRVRAKDGDGQHGAWSAVQNLTVNIGAVSGLSPADGATTTDTTPALSWNAVSGAAGYEVQIAASEGGLANSVAIDVTEASYTPATALTNLQTHYWRVRAKDGDGQAGSWSAEHSLNVVDDGSVYVEGGSFQMGSTAGYSDEEPVHQVTVSTFYMSRYEVTHGQYLEFLNGAGVSAAGRLNGNEVIDMDDSDVAFSHDGTLFSFSGSGVADSIDCPVMEVTWYGAAEYANWLSAESGLTKVYTINGTSVTADWDANGYRQPTEAEWEYAARGGNASKGYLYAGSDNADEVGWYSSNSGQSTHPVGGKAPNELGLYDMSGNVYEWCWDWKGSYSSGSQSNPRGPASGSGRGRRGGSWVNSARNLRSASRSSFGPGDSDNGLGFRLVRREF